MNLSTRRKLNYERPASSLKLPSLPMARGDICFTAYSKVLPVPRRLRLYYLKIVSIGHLFKHFWIKHESGCPLRCSLSALQSRSFFNKRRRIGPTCGLRSRPIRSSYHGDSTDIGVGSHGMWSTSCYCIGILGYERPRDRIYSENILCSTRNSPDRAKSSLRSH